MRSKLVFLAVCLALVSGCVAGAKEQFAKVQVGMTKPQVAEVLGQPEEVEYVRFSGHDSDYEVWQYQMVPNTPICPSEAVPRYATALATAGLSEIAWTHAKAGPHWIYFLDGSMVFTSPAFDCLNGEMCKVKKKDTSAAAAK